MHHYTFERDVLCTVQQPRNYVAVQIEARLAKLRNGLPRNRRQQYILHYVGRRPSGVNQCFGLCPDHHVLLSSLVSDRADSTPDPSIISLSEPRSLTRSYVLHIKEVIVRYHRAVRALKELLYV